MGRLSFFVGGVYRKKWEGGIGVMIILVGFWEGRKYFKSRRLVQVECTRDEMA